MVPWEFTMGGMLAVFLVIYALTGGADFGGGIWDMLSGGPRAETQRKLISKAIGPIWEANHVWLIVLIVIMFYNFPKAFSLISTALHIPLTIMLFGIVLRGSAFAFRSYDTEAAQERWSRLFAVGSTISPLMLGICLGSLSAGHIQLDENGVLANGFLQGWLQPFPIAVGVLTLAMFAFLAAVYLTNEAREPELKEDFRRRALISAVVVFLLAWICFAVAQTNAPFIGDSLSRAPWAVPFHLITGLVGLGAFIAIWRRHYKTARMLAAAQVALMVMGWALSQYPYLVYPSHTVMNASAPDALLGLTFKVLVVGALVLAPSFIYLYRVFSFHDGRK